MSYILKHLSLYYSQSMWKPDKEYFDAYIKEDEYSYVVGILSAEPDSIYIRLYDFDINFSKEESLKFKKDSKDSVVQYDYMDLVGWVYNAYVFNKDGKFIGINKYVLLKDDER